MMLVHFMRWLKEHRPDVQFDVLVLNPPYSLMEEADFIENIYFWPQKNSKENSIKTILLTRTKARLKIRRFRKELVNNHYQLIYANTIRAFRMGVVLKKAFDSTVLLLHLHEMPTVIENVHPSFGETAGKADHIIVPSKLSRTQLLAAWPGLGISPKVVYECARTGKESNTSIDESARIIIGGAGTVHWRKGPDIFIQVARILQKKRPDLKVEFRWMGGFHGNEERIVAADLRKAGLENYVQFTGEVKDPAAFLSEISVFLLTSREDPFPLVCIEAGMQGKPIVCFQNASGTAEMLSGEFPEVIPYLDTEQMAEAVAYFVSNSEARKEAGNRNRDVFSRFDPESICPQLVSELDNAVNKT